MTASERIRQARQENHKSLVAQSAQTADVRKTAPLEAQFSIKVKS